MRTLVIKNNTEYNQVKHELEHLVNNIDSYVQGEIDEAKKYGHDPKLADSSRAFYEAQIEDLKFRLWEYHNLVDGEFHISKLDAINEIIRNLIHARESQGLSLAQFAFKIGATADIVQDCEEEHYEQVAVVVSKIINALIREWGNPSPLFNELPESMYGTSEGYVTRGSPTILELPAHHSELTTSGTFENHGAVAV